MFFIIKVLNTFDDSFQSRNLVSYDALQCYARYGTSMPDTLRSSIKRSLHPNTAHATVQEVSLKEDPTFRSVMSTTSAVDLIGGGVRTDALPENA